jgi:hypothetical protein
MQPVTLDEQVVWLDRENDEALYLDVGADNPKPHVRRRELPSTPTFVTRRNDADELLVLVTDEDTRSDTKLVVLDATGVEREYDLGTQFSSLTQSDDGRYVIAHFSASNGGETTRGLFNPNEIAIIDLEREGDDAVVQRTLRSLGATPRHIEFSPSMEIAGTSRRLAVVFFDSELALIDLRHQDRPEYTIQLSRGSNIVLSQARFSTDDQKIYLLAQGSTDVYVLRLLPSGGNRENDYEPSLNQLGTDASPQDMAIFDSGSERRLLVASGGSAQVVEASSSRVTEIPLEASASQILLFEGSAPFDDEVEQRALLYQPGSNRLSFLDLDEVEERTTRNLETLSVNASVNSLVQLEDNRVLLTHGGSGLSILDLEERTAAPIQASIPLEDAIASFETGRIWVALGATRSIGYIDMNNLHPGEVQLDLPISNLMVMPQTQTPRLVVIHPEAAGAVSILSALEPEAEDEAITLEGIFYEGLLD